MSATAILVHGGESVRPRYEAALPGFTFHVVYKGGFSAPYEELANSTPLAAFVHSVAPEWQEGDPLVLIGFSAGCFAPRIWMRDAGSRDMVSALVLLDGMHSKGSDTSCDPSSLDGIFAFADMAHADPSAHLLVVTNTDIVPPGYASTSACAAALLDHVGATPRAKRDEGRVAGVVVLDYGGTTAADHNAQQTEVGPEVLKELVAPWIAAPAGDKRPAGAFWVVVLGAIGIGWMFWKGRNMVRVFR